MTPQPTLIDRLVEVFALLPPKPYADENGFTHLFIDPYAGKRLHQVRDALERAITEYEARPSGHAEALALVDAARWREAFMRWCFDRGDITGLDAMAAFDKIARYAALSPSGPAPSSAAVGDGGEL